MNYYNENDPNAAAWLRELIAGGQIPDGEVDERSICDVEAADLGGFVQHHFFCGISGWVRALDLARWPRERPVWTGSCPCQPFSSAGKRKGESDERHLWPEFARLIGQCRPATIFGEQTVSPLGRAWLNRVFADAEELGYAVAGADLSAACIGAPHIRQRLYWVAHAAHDGRPGRNAPAGSVEQWEHCSTEPDDGRELRRSVIGHGASGGLANAENNGASNELWGRQSDAQRHSSDCGLADASRRRCQQCESEVGCVRVSDANGSDCGLADAASQRTGRLGEKEQRDAAQWRRFNDSCANGGLGDSERARLEGHAGHECDWHQSRRLDAQSHGSIAATCRGNCGLVNTDGARPESGQFAAAPAGHGSAALATGGDFWGDVDWLPCLDGKARRIERGLLPLADGLSTGVVHGGAPSIAEAQNTAEARVMRLKGYGNAIVPQLAAEFIGAFMEVN